MAKIRKDLIGSVLIDSGDGGDPIALVAGATVPDGVELGAHVLAPESGKSDEEKAAEKAAAKAAKKAAKVTAPAAPAAPATEGDLVIPPQSGRGSGDAAWHTYATSAAAKAGLQIEIPADAKKVDIIDALRGAGIPVE